MDETCCLWKLSGSLTSLTQGGSDWNVLRKGVVFSFPLLDCMPNRRCRFVENTTKSFFTKKYKKPAWNSGSVSSRHPLWGWRYGRLLRNSANPSSESEIRKPPILASGATQRPGNRRKSASFAFQSRIFCPPGATARFYIFCSHFTATNVQWGGQSYWKELWKETQRLFLYIYIKKVKLSNVFNSPPRVPPSFLPDFWCNLISLLSSSRFFPTIKLKTTLSMRNMKRHFTSPQSHRQHRDGNFLLEFSKVAEGLALRDFCWKPYKYLIKKLNLIITTWKLSHKGPQVSGTPRNQWISALVVGTDWGFLAAPNLCPPPPSGPRPFVYNASWTNPPIPRFHPGFLSHAAMCLPSEFELFLDLG